MVKQRLSGLVPVPDGSQRIVTRPAPSSRTDMTIRRMGKPPLTDQARDRRAGGMRVVAVMTGRAAYATASRRHHRNGPSLGSGTNSARSTVPESEPSGSSATITNSRSEEADNTSTTSPGRDRSGCLPRGRERGDHQFQDRAGLPVDHLVEVDQPTAAGRQSDQIPVHQTVTMRRPLGRRFQSLDHPDDLPVQRVELNQRACRLRLHEVAQQRQFPAVHTPRHRARHRPGDSRAPTPGCPATPPYPTGTDRSRRTRIPGTRGSAHGDAPPPGTRPPR